ncbi:embryonic polarity protein dorsal-like isoform X2 [Coccinella septempunctata]|nr:embryonic polarity protein dorsal-like isoform X2 [Coccinella septempunctata]XP_044760530.1 embryonic polarity protein dorsal-like isoform X2 [Coccinella septempunctata]
MFNGGCEILQPTSIQTLESSPRAKHDAYVKIIEQPAPKALRFRYLCEGRSAGSIPGISSTPENKTFPAIQVVGYQGRAVVVVSCVTKDQPYRPHPHNLVGREGCKRGVCTLEIPTETMSIQFCNLGIQCVKKKEIESALRLREEIRVDPFRTGFSHRNQPTSIDLNSVRLCFQVFLEGDKKGKFTVPLTPVVSDPVFDKKTASDLVIVKLSHCVCPADGDRTEIILLCEKITKEDIQIRYYEERDGLLVWEDYGEFQPAQVHKQVAICFKPPRYHNTEITDPVKVLVQLKRPSDGATSESVPFEFLPVIDRKRKRPKFDSLLNLTQDLMLGANSPFLNIKMEPRDNNFPWTQGAPMDISNIMPSNPNPPSLPTASALPPMTWNLPYTLQNLQPTPTQPSAQNVMDSNGLRSLLDLDSHNTELKQINLNSGELGSFEAALDVTHLSDTLNTNLSLTDIQVGGDQNMTDSLTRLANNTIDSICQGTNTFK